MAVADPMTQRSASVVCVCGNNLGVGFGPSWGQIIRSTHHGRQIIAAQIIAIVCERCERVWRPPLPDVTEGDACPSERLNGG